MTITPKSAKREISDLQRLLLSLGLMKFTNRTESGKWGDETQDAVVALYAQLGWDHDTGDKWVTSPAMAAATGLHAAWHANTVVTGGGSHAGGGGSHAGGGGSHAGGGGSHAGGGGSHAGGGGSHAG